MTRLCAEWSGVEVEAQVGDCLIDLTDVHPDLGVSFACRSATCGICRVVVHAGADAFAPPGEGERETLEAFGVDARTRLGCQLQIVNDVGRVTLRLADE